MSSLSCKLTKKELENKYDRKKIIVVSSGRPCQIVVIFFLYYIIYGARYPKVLAAGNWKILCKIKTIGWPVCDVYASKKI